MEISIYRSEPSKDQCLAIYDETLRDWPVPYEETWVETPFGQTHILSSGQTGQPPLVLLHGQWATSAMWHPFIQALSNRNRVYAVDQIDDIGKSRPERLPASRSDYAEWLGAVFKRLGLERAAVAGLSYGGFLAANFAIASPYAVERLILLCPGIPNFGAPTWRWMVRGLPVMLFPARWSAEWLVRGLAVTDFQPDHPEVKQLITGVRNIRSRIPFRPCFDDEEFSRLDMPVLLLVGQHEAMYDAAVAVDHASQLIPHISAQIVPLAGHMLGRDQAGVVLEKMLGFLSAAPNTLSAK